MLPLVCKFKLSLKYTVIPTERAVLCRVRLANVWWMGWTIVRYPVQTWVVKTNEPQKVRWRRRISIAANSRSPTHFWTIFGWRRRRDSASLGLSYMTELWRPLIAFQHTGYIGLRRHSPYIYISSLTLLFHWNCSHLTTVYMLFKYSKFILQLYHEIVLWKRCYVIIWILNLCEITVYLLCRKIVSMWKETQVENWKHNNISENPTDARSSIGISETSKLHMESI